MVKLGWLVETLATDKPVMNSKAGAAKLRHVCMYFHVCYLSLTAVAFTPLNWLLNVLAVLRKDNKAFCYLFYRIVMLYCVASQHTA